MTLTSKISLAFIITFALFAAYFLGTYTQVSEANTADGLVARVATTSTPTITSTASLVFATSSCVSRTISTASSSIMIGFTDAEGFSPNAYRGFWQAASTTETYDASQFGCNAVRIYSAATAGITVMEAR